MNPESVKLPFGHSLYSHSIRSDILPLIDRKYSHVLDVGCSSGNTGVMLKECGLCDYVIGIEPFAATAQIAKKKLDKVLQDSIENAIHEIPDESLDCILCLDVLEHLIDPWKVSQDLGKKLKKDGVMILSIPNIRHISVIFNLVFLGRWHYEDAGILDRTHLRFFTKKSITELSQINGFQLEQMRGHIGKKSKILNTLTFGVFRNFFYGQYQTRIRKLADV